MCNVNTVRNPGFMGLSHVLHRPVAPAARPAMPQEGPSGKLPGSYLDLLVAGAHGRERLRDLWPAQRPAVVRIELHGGHMRFFSHNLIVQHSSWQLHRLHPDACVPMVPEQGGPRHTETGRRAEPGCAYRVIAPSDLRGSDVLQGGAGY